MVEFDFKRPTRHCCVSDQPIRPGQEYYTALRENELGELERSDWSVPAWTGPPPGCIAWWKSRIPSLDQGRVYWAPHDVLRSVFQYFLEQPNAMDSAFVMGLLLLRKRLVQLRETIHREGENWLVLFDPKSENIIELREVELEASRAAAIQAELAEKLFTSHGTPDAETDTGEAE